jgi:hypothetical protein
MKRKKQTNKEENRILKRKGRKLGEKGRRNITN